MILEYELEGTSYVQLRVWCMAVLIYVNIYAYTYVCICMYVGVGGNCAYMRLEYEDQGTSDA